MLIVTSTVYGKREPMNTNNVENYNERYSPERETYVIKKDGSLEAFHVQKVIDAIGKSAYRALTKFTPEEKEQICECVISHIDALESTQVPISVMHNIVENALEQVRPIVAKSYRDYRNYKQDFVRMLDDVYKKSQAIMYVGDKENSNADSALVSTKRSLIFNQLNKELYQKFFLTTEEIQACRDGYIYIHDMSARRDTMNCCLFDVGNVLKGGFEMGNVWYNEPKTLDTAFDVMGDIVLSTAAQQYGGFTVPEVDKILAPYAQKSYDYYVKEFLKYTDASWEGAQEKAIEYAIDKVRRECDQGWQGIEYKLNTVGSSRGDYPFVTVTLGLGTSMFEKMISISLLEVHKNGQGKKGHKKPVLFPKIVFLYDKAIHGEGGIAEDVFEAGLDCSSKTMYPDWLSMSGEGYIAEMYKKYKRVISPMGCRAFLSPWYKEGGMKPACEKDEPIFVGRFNIGAVSLHLPMILAKARAESRDFYEVLDFYLQMIRNLHIRTYEYLGQMRASTNPLAYCEGGFLGGHLKLTDKIKPLLKSATASFGITALNELQELYNGKSLVEDGAFAVEVLEHINQKISEYKEEDGNLYAIYGTPAETLCYRFARIDREKYGDISNVTDKGYYTNSYHVDVREKIDAFTKFKIESEFQNKSLGGAISYVEVPNLTNNVEAIEEVIRFIYDNIQYGEFNTKSDYCQVCGYDGEIMINDNMEWECPQCHNKDHAKMNVTRRTCGYLGENFWNAGKTKEIKARVLHL
mgnify:CR=1 FL=1